MFIRSPLLVKLLHFQRYDTRLIAVSAGACAEMFARMRACACAR